jgi:hypothetical protein
MRELGDEFPRERLGVPSAEDSGAGVFGAGKWAACLDAQSSVSDQVVALDVAQGMQFASFGVAGTRTDGLLHVELIERHPGTGWVVARAKDLASKWGPIGLDPRAPVAGLLDELKAAGVPIVELPDGQFPRACATLQEKVENGTVRHIGQGPLDAAVAGAAIKPAGDAWRWSRSSSQVDISPLVVITVALHLAATGGVPQFISLAEV